MAMNIHPKNKDALSGNLLVGGNSPDAKPLAVLAVLDISASAIASAPVRHLRWELFNRKQETEVPIPNIGKSYKLY
jgi:hypothetical protein